MRRNQLRYHQQQDPEEIRIVLVGKTGNGKSKTGSTILKDEHAFKSTASLTSGTQTCQKCEAVIFEKKLVVVDTPGLFDTNTDERVNKEEIGKCVCMSVPGPHIFLLVITLGRRYTSEEKKAVLKIGEMFGEMAKKYTIILFTGMDCLEAEGETLEGLLMKDTLFQELVAMFGNRYHGFNNLKNDDTQVRVLLEKIDEVQQINGGHFYTNEMYETASKELHEHMEKILETKLPEIQKKEEKLSRAKDIEELWKEEFKKIKGEATTKVATLWRLKGRIALATLLGVGVGATGGLLGVVAGVISSAAGGLGGFFGSYNYFKKK